MANPWQPSRDHPSSDGRYAFSEMDSPDLDSDLHNDFSAYCLDSHVNPLSESDYRESENLPGPARPEPDVPPSGDPWANTDTPAPHVAPHGGLPPVVD